MAPDLKDVVETTKKSPDKVNNSNRMKLVTAAAIVTLTTATQAQSLLDKCLAFDGDINNNGKVTKFEKKICMRANKLQNAQDGLQNAQDGLQNAQEEGKRLDEEGKRLDEEGKRLDEEGKRLKKRLGEVLAQK